MHEQETPTPDLTAQDAGLPDDLDPAMTDVHRTRAQVRRDLAYLLGAMALVNSVNDGPRERQPSADPTAFDHFQESALTRRILHALLKLEVESRVYSVYGSSHDNEGYYHGKDLLAELDKLEATPGSPERES